MATKESSETTVEKEEEITGFDDETEGGEGEGSGGGEDGEGILNSLRYYMELRSDNSTTVIRNGNLDLMIPAENNGNEGDVIPLMHYFTILPFTTGDYIPNRGYFEEATSAVLAVEHLNTANPVIVPELEGLQDRCPIRFTLELADTEYSGGVALNRIVQAVNRPYPEGVVPSAVIGAYRSAISMPTSIVTGIFGYPQISPGSTSADLDDKSQYPLFGRTVPSDQGNTVPIILYLYNKLNVRHLAVINVNDAYGNAYVEGMRMAAETKTAGDMTIVQIPLDEGDVAIRAAVQTLKATGFRFVFGVVFTRETHDALLLEAYDQGVAGTGVHNWMFGDSFLGVLNDRTVPVDSPLRKVYRGVGLMEVTGGVAGIPSYDNYAEQMKKLKNPTDLATLGDLFPKHPGQPAYETAGVPPYVDDPTFLDPIGSGFAPFAYEAAVALGLAACEIYQGEEVEFLGPAHYEAFKYTTFTGVGGQVRFDNVTGSRLPDSALHKVANWLESEPETDPVTDEQVVRFLPHVTDIFVDGKWVEQQPYVFNDGTTNVPADLEPQSSGNTGALWGMAIGIPVVFCAIISVVVYVVYERKRKANDSVWHVEKDELNFMEPPEIIGRGTFGLVLLAEYRGTQVAVKRVIPPKSAKSKDGRLDPTLPPPSEHTEGSQGAESEDSGGNNSNNKSGTDDGSSNATPGKNNIGMQSMGVKSAGGLASMGISSIGFGSGVNSGVNGGMSSGAAFGSWVGSGVGGLFSMQRARRQSNEKKRSGSETSHNWRKMKQEFVEEMRYLSKLRHPCVTTIMGAVLGKDPMLVMEYMEHGSLYDILHNETMVIDSELLLPILRDISQGVRFLHCANPQVIHGDLKAANILVDSRFRAKVADFGLSQKQNLGGTGTPFWMAPELLRRESANTAATDAYSFGIILYEVYSRRDPYENEDALEVLKLVADPKIRKRPPTPRYMPTKVKALMADCLDEDPEQRPTFEEAHTRVKRIDGEGADPMAPKKANAATVSLFDIFPRHIAEALRDGRPVEAEHKDCVTIFFSDIVGFTNISSELTPQKVASMLDRLYTKFDELSHAHDVFKVETIGDAYMAVSNLVKDQKDDHCKRIAEFATEAIIAANDTVIDLEDKERGCVNIRVGFHSGPVVADVVGTRNPRYCLFGDTVNTASRMESTSEVNRIHCSKPAAKILKKQCPSVPLKSRGKVQIKGKGKMHTFWVNEQGTFRSSSLDMVDSAARMEIMAEDVSMAMESGSGIDLPESPPQIGRNKLTLRKMESAEELFASSDGSSDFFAAAAEESKKQQKPHSAVEAAPLINLDSVPEVSESSDHGPASPVRGSLTQGANVMATLPEGISCDILMSDHNIGRDDDVAEDEKKSDVEAPMPSPPLPPSYAKEEDVASQQMAPMAPLEAFERRSMSDLPDPEAAPATTTTVPTPPPANKEAAPALAPFASQQKAASPMAPLDASERDESLAPPLSAAPPESAPIPAALAATSIKAQPNSSSSSEAAPMAPREASERDESRTSSLSSSSSSPAPEAAPATRKAIPDASAATPAAPLHGVAASTPAGEEMAPLTTRAASQKSLLAAASSPLKAEDSEKMKRKLAERLGYPHIINTVDQSTGESKLLVKI